MTATTKKLTKMEMFERVLSRLTNADEIDFIKHEMDLLQSKNSNKKPTANQQENEMFKELIEYFLVENAEEKFNISEIQAKVPEVEKLSNQRMSALMKQLVESGKVNKAYEKRKAYFYA